MRTVMTIGGILALLTACGGTADPAGSAGAGEATSAPASAAVSVAAEPTAPAGTDADPGTNGSTSGLATDGDATAVVVIGDQRYEFADLYCVTMGGALGAVTLAADPSVDINLPPEGWETSGDDWDPPSVQLSGDEPYFDFHAGGETVELMGSIEEGASQVDSYESDGFHATGTATFADLANVSDVPAPLTGTFEVTCPRP